MPEILFTRHTLAVRDLAASRAYYLHVLGMEVDFDVPGWAFLSRGPWQVMLGECVDATPAGELGDHAYVGYLNVQDIDALHAAFAGRGASVTQPLADKPWGMREFGIVTLDGHRWMFGQELADAAA
jgi:uncharacterized glyoxalase superfamily protein PhnB